MRNAPNLRAVAGGRSETRPYGKTWTGWMRRESEPKDEDRSFAPLRMATNRLKTAAKPVGMCAALASAGERRVLPRVLRFGASRMVGYTSRPVGGLESLIRGVRQALRVRRDFVAGLRGCRLFAFIYLAIVFAHRADCTRT
jgi:hypothetical protein